MTEPVRPTDVEEFFAVARAASLISPEVAEVLAAEVAAGGVDPAEYVLQQGVMDAVAVDIVQTLTRPHDVAAGYEVQELIGRGGLGVVYRARQTALDRHVALKTILVSQMTQRDSVARFEREAKLVARLRHPNIVVAFDFGRQRGRVWLIMELVEGDDLATWIARRGVLDEAATWGILRQAAAGLAHAANEDVVHRDVKPSNLLLIAAPAGSAIPSGAPMVKIADFGLARICDAPASDPRITTDGCTLGSPQYMAPEQIGGADVDLRADIYALGATAYHMLTGRVPFEGLSLGEILMRKSSGGMPRVDSARRGLSAESVQLVADMTETDPARRIGDYTQLLERIDRLPAFAASAPLVDATQVGQRADTATLALEDTLPIMPAAPTTDAAPSKSSTAAPRFGRRKWAWLGAIASLALVLALVVLLGDIGRRRRSDGDGPRYVLTGRGAPLFDGQRISDWRSTAGVWFATDDAEGGRVLSGNGTVRRQLPKLPVEGSADSAPPAHYQLDVAVDLQTATAVELHFGIVQAAAGRQPRYVLRAGEEGVVLGRMSTERAPLEALSDVVAFPPRKPDPSVPSYHLLRVERHGTFWRAYFDAQPLGGLPADAAAELAEFRLMTEGGPALFDALQVSELAPPGE